MKSGSMTNVWTLISIGSCSNLVSPGPLGLSETLANPIPYEEGEKRHPVRSPSLDPAMDFDQQLKNAIARGSRSRDAKSQAAQSAAMSAEESKNRHASMRLHLSEEIEDRLRKLADHFPGFEFSTLIGEDGWGARITRDDLRLSRGKSSEAHYSRLEMLIVPKGTTPIIELIAKGTIRNREIFSYRHYQYLDDADLSGFASMISLWAVEYAEQFAAHRV